MYSSVVQLLQSTCSYNAVVMYNEAFIIALVTQIMYHIKLELLNNYYIILIVSLTAPPVIPEWDSEGWRWTRLQGQETYPVVF